MKLKITNTAVGIAVGIAIIVGLIAYFKLNDTGSFTLFMIPIITLVNVIRIVELKKREKNSSYTH